MVWRRRILAWKKNPGQTSEEREGWQDSERKEAEPRWCCLASRNRQGTEKHRPPPTEGEAPATAWPGHRWRDSSPRKGGGCQTSPDGGNQNLLLYCSIDDSYGSSYISIFLVPRTVKWLIHRVIKSSIDSYKLQSCTILSTGRKKELEWIAKIVDLSQPNLYLPRFKKKSTFTYRNVSTILFMDQYLIFSYMDRFMKGVNSFHTIEKYNPSFHPLCTYWMVCMIFSFYLWHVWHKRWVERIHDGIYRCHVKQLPYPLYLKKHVIRLVVRHQSWLSEYQNISSSWLQRRRRLL